MNRQHRARGFTLIELLTVIGIIGLLVALLFPAIGTARNAAARARARREMSSIDSGMRSFRVDYGRFPLQDGTEEDRQYSDADYVNLINSLRGNNPTDNPLRNAYLDVSESSLENGVLLDPWGERYRVAADWSGDNRISATAMSPHPEVRGRGVAAWSVGADGESTPRDRHIKSWEN